MIVLISLITDNNLSTQATSSYGLEDKGGGARMSKLEKVKLG